MNCVKPIQFGVRLLTRGQIFATDKRQRRSRHLRALISQIPTRFTSALRRELTGRRPAMCTGATELASVVTAGPLLVPCFRNRESSLVCSTGPLVSLVGHTVPLVCREGTRTTSGWQVCGHRALRRDGCPLQPGAGDFGGAWTSDDALDTGNEKNVYTRR